MRLRLAMKFEIPEGRRLSFRRFRKPASHPVHERKI
jgi:hypothetical protein